jgi:hypothetical protein
LAYVPILRIPQYSNNANHQDRVRVAEKGYIYVLVVESSGFHHTLTNELPGGGWSGAGVLLGDGVLL